jgi:hypothetical protein
MRNIKLKTKEPNTTSGELRKFCLMKEYFQGTHTICWEEKIIMTFKTPCHL